MKKLEIIFPILIVLVSIMFSIETKLQNESASSEVLNTNYECCFQSIEEETTYSEDDIALLAHIINAEQGIEYDDEEKNNKLQIYTGQVVLNRMNQAYRGASTIEEILYSPGQYACISDCSWDNPVSERAYKNAELLISGEPYWEIYNIPKMPDDVIYQAEFPQGSSIWMNLGDTYFCYK